ncbi:hypothetical protein [Actinomadura sp. WMMA1423]|uniref:hypothetical protein n=1 Tax=Actinomadura sp. WMMA1423 TaxID=2591108 RepID=UPI0011468BF2|nr:hypothetical protein [Actinomadura sp. WMMA1423]
MRTLPALGVTALTAAALGTGQVLAAELTGITTLGGDFTAGAERVQGVQVTLVAWYCAVAVPAAVVLATAGREVRTRMAAVPAGVLGTLATCPVLMQRASGFVSDDVLTAALVGVLLGSLCALAAAVAPVIGKGLVAYAVFQWGAGLAFTALVPRTVVYAGMVQPLGLDFLVRLRPEMPDLPDNLGYHLPPMLPVAIAVPVLAGAVSAVAVRRTKVRGASMAAGAAGPVLSAVLYRLVPEQDVLWNEAAATVVDAVAACSLLVAAVPDAWQGARGLTSRFSHTSDR